MKESVEQEILAQEENLTQAKRSLDLSVLDRLYADDVLFTGVTGEVCGKAGMLSEARQGIIQRDAAVAQGKKFTASVNKEGMKVVTHGDTAVASYRFLVQVQGEGIDIKRRYRNTDVWLKRENTWQVIRCRGSGVSGARIRLGRQMADLEQRQRGRALVAQQRRVAIPGKRPDHGRQLHGERKRFRRR
jgi:ketosteroid isomerase-like protein